jgi:hypothetical protein
MQQQGRKAAAAAAERTSAMQDTIRHDNVQISIFIWLMSVCCRGPEPTHAEVSQAAGFDLKATHLPASTLHVAQASEPHMQQRRQVLPLT